jgi:lauroyl/myristoyl acyltransferase
MTAVVESRQPLPRTRAAAARGRRSIRGWLGARALGVLSAVLSRLPEVPLQHAAHAFGGVLYRIQPARRRLVRNNLARVVGYLAERGMGGERVAAAARDPRALDRLVRSAFGHYARGYVEVATLRAYADADRLERVRPDDPEASSRAFGGTDSGTDAGAMIIIGLHFGAIEIPALWATKRLGRRITAPMESVADADLQGYFERTRKQTGLNVIPLQNAARALRGALAAGETVALVADRPIGGSGMPVELFGAPARLPIGPAILALESGSPAWVVATRRVRWNQYRSRIELVDMPADGTRRQRISGFLDAQARAFEAAVADAPDQWWTTFFPIWEDIAA